MNLTGKIKPVQTVIVAGGGNDGNGWPQGWSNQTATAPKGIGLSISEPLFSAGDYYQEPSSTNPLNPSDTTKEWYSPFLDQPEDSDPSHSTRPLLQDNLVGQNMDLARYGKATPTTPVNYEDADPTDTYDYKNTVSRYKTVFLQRLASPNDPYDPVSNPYRTVDWMPIDLTVFNGEDTPAANSWHDAWNNPNAAWDPDDPTGTMNNGMGNQAKIQIVSRQRGAWPLPQSLVVSGTTDNNLWTPASSHLLWNNSTISSGLIAEGVTPVTDCGAIISKVASHTLGYLNTTFWAPNGATPPNPWVDGTGTTANCQNYLGDPLQPFPWITISGRPFISELELLQVPASYPARLFWEFSYVGNPQTPNSIAPTPYAAPNLATSWPYPHLASFFQSALASNSQPPQVHRLLEYVTVPSRFVGTETQVPPFLWSANGTPNWFYPPMNRISAYREPGRINLNTIASPNVFYGLTDYSPGTANLTYWEKFVRSRRGNNPASPGTPPTDLPSIQNSIVPQPSNTAIYNPAYPTYFARPFRSSSAARMISDTAGPNAIKVPAVQYTRAADNSGNVYEVDGTVLRADPDLIDQPLFGLNGTVLGTASGAQPPSPRK